MKEPMLNEGSKTDWKFMRSEMTWNVCDQITYETKVDEMVEKSERNEWIAAEIQYE